MKIHICIGAAGVIVGLAFWRLVTRTGITGAYLGVLTEFVVAALLIVAGVMVVPKRTKRIGLGALVFLVSAAGTCGLAVLQRGW